MYCEVTLSQKFPKSMGIFDYEIPKELEADIKIGQLVNIPFRSSKKEGVIIKIKEKAIAGKNIKAIDSIIDQNPIITHHQIELAEWMSKYYFVSLGTIIKTILPPIPKKKRELKKQKYLYNLDKSKKHLYTKTIFNEKNKSLFYIPKNHLDKFNLIADLCQETKQQTLIIFPTIKDIESFIKYLPQNIESQVAIINNSLNKTQYYDAWNKIINNKCKIIIGTKLALFTPLIKPELLIIDQISNQNHKQADQNPRYDSRKVIKKISSIFKTKLLFINPTLTINSYKKNIEKKNLVINNKKNIENVEIIDMKHEQLKKNYSIFSDSLVLKIKQMLDSNKKIFLFINKRGSATSVLCRDCGQTLVCDNCNQSLTYHEKDKTLYCHQCNKKFELPPFCPNCHGPNFKFIGTGTQKVELEINKLFGNKKTLRLDQDSEDIKNINEYQIIIGTEFALPLINWENISLTGVISADTLLYLPDFGASERTWHLLNNLISYSDSPVLIQTYNTENPAIKYFIENPDKFYQNEIKERKELSYPPFTEIIKLIYSNLDKNKCLKETQRVYNLLDTNFFTKSIITPLNPFSQKKWRMYIILKLKQNIDPEQLSMQMDIIPDHWIIDRNPQNLL